MNRYLIVLVCVSASLREATAVVDFDRDIKPIFEASCIKCHGPEKQKADFRAAYAALVDELLASPHFGERWAQHWLDVIRWAESNGSEANLYRRNAWIYRNYVVRAFNEDRPYDQFVREQIAGDQLGVGEATGFLVAGPHVPAATVGQEPSAIRQARADRMDEIRPSLPNADPRSDRPRCGGRESNFLAVAVGGHPQLQTPLHRATHSQHKYKPVQGTHYIQ